MRVRPILFLLFFSFFLTNSAAQDIVFKIGGGLASKDSGDTRIVGSFRLGLAYDWLIGNGWSIEPSVYYMAKGWKNKDNKIFITDENGALVLDKEGNPVVGMMNETTNLNYIEIPVLVNYAFNVCKGHRNLVVSAGPYAAYGVGGKTKVKGDTAHSSSERLYYDYSAFGNHRLHRFDVGLAAAAAYRFTENLEVGLMSDFGLTELSSSGGHNYSFTVTLGYRF